MESSTHFATSGTGTITEVAHPLVQHKLGLLRDVTTTTQMFRQLVNELTLLLTYEATKDLADEEVEIETPLEQTAARRISGKKVAICPIATSSCWIRCSRPGTRRPLRSRPSSALAPHPCVSSR